MTSEGYVGVVSGSGFGILKTTLNGYTCLEGRAASRQTSFLDLLRP